MPVVQYIFGGGGLGKGWGGGVKGFNPQAVTVPSTMICNTVECCDMAQAEDQPGQRSNL